MRERGESSRKGVNLKKRGKGTKKGRKINELSVVLIKNRNLSIEKKNGADGIDGRFRGGMYKYMYQREKSHNKFVRSWSRFYLHPSVEIRITNETIGKI